MNRTGSLVDLAVLDDVQNEQSTRKRSESWVGGHRPSEKPKDELDNPEDNELQVLQKEQERIKEEQEKLKALQPFSGYYLDVLIKPWSENESTGTKRYFYKPLRGLVRTVYALAVCMLAAPVGAIHHFHQFIKGINDSDSDIKKRSWEHLTAASIDARAFFEGVVMTALAVLIVSGTYMVYLQSMWLMVLAGTSLSTGLLAFGTPLPAYMLAPQTMQEKYLLQDYLEKKFEIEKIDRKLKLAQELRAAEEIRKKKEDEIINLSRALLDNMDKLMLNSVEKFNYQSLNAFKERIEHQLAQTNIQLIEIISSVTQAAIEMKKDKKNSAIFERLKPALIKFLNFDELTIGDNLSSLKELTDSK